MSIKRFNETSQRIKFKLLIIENKTDKSSNKYISPNETIYLSDKDVHDTYNDILVYYILDSKQKQLPVMIYCKGYRYLHKIFKNIPYCIVLSPSDIAYTINDIDFYISGNRYKKGCGFLPNIFSLANNSI